MIRILTVEDEKPISNLIRISLEKAGYSCTCAYDGAEAAEFLEKKGFADLIVERREMKEKLAALLKFHATEMAQ